MGGVWVILWPHLPAVLPPSGRSGFLPAVEGFPDKPLCVSLPFIRPLSQLSTFGNIQYVTCIIYYSSFPFAPTRVQSFTRSPLTQLSIWYTYCNMLISKVPFRIIPLRCIFPCLLLPTLPFASQLSHDAKLTLEYEWLFFLLFTFLFFSRTFHIGVPLKLVRIVFLPFILLAELQFLSRSFFFLN